MEQFFVGRQPILTKTENIFGFELLFRDASMTGAHITDHKQATATVMANALNNIGFSNLVGDKKGFINVNTEILSSGIVELLPKEHTVLEILEHVKVDDTLIGLCKNLKKKGYAFALDDFQYNESFLPLFNIAEYIKIETFDSIRADIEKTVGLLKEYPIKLLAEKVETKEDFIFCSNLGFKFFQGYFFAKPSIITGKSISPSQAILFNLFTSVSKEDNVNVIEAFFRKNPQLNLKLLTFMNSASYYMSQKITSIRHAIAMLGYHNLQKWVVLLLFANQTDDMKSNPLLERASVRGLTLELLAKRMSGNHSVKNSAFITGALSLIDTLLGIPLDEALSGLNLSSEITGALLKREGMLGILSEIVEKLEKEDYEQLNTMLIPFNVGLHDVLSIETQAIIEYEKSFLQLRKKQRGSPTPHF